MDENEIQAGLISLIGALAVIVVYWIHQLWVGSPPITESGVSVTIFLAAFFAQYIPLSMIRES